MTQAERMALDEEAQSLPIHVRMCAMRYDATMRAIEANHAELAEIKLYAKRGMQALWGLIILIAGGGIVSMPQIARVAQALSGN